MSSEDLAVFRREIDEIDRQWILVLARRFEVTEAVGTLKRRENLPAADPQREACQVRALREYAAKTNVDPDLVEGIFRLITERVRSRHRQISAD